MPKLQGRGLDKRTVQYLSPAGLGKSVTTKCRFHVEESLLGVWCSHYQITSCPEPHLSKQKTHTHGAQMSMNHWQFWDIFTQGFHPEPTTSSSRSESKYKLCCMKFYFFWVNKDFTVRYILVDEYIIRGWIDDERKRGGGTGFPFIYCEEGKKELGRGNCHNFLVCECVDNDKSWDTINYFLTGAAINGLELCLIVPQWPHRQCLWIQIRANLETTVEKLKFLKINEFPRWQMLLKSRWMKDSQMSLDR